jgi:DNA polymerase I-like protein with 3'-5' exonuclease and polymerase domains
VYQEGWSKAIIFDCFFIPLVDVLHLLYPCACVFHNGSYDLHTINRHTKDVWVPAASQDTLYLSRLEWYGEQSFGFYDCLEYAGLNDAFIQSIDKKENQKSDWSSALTDIQLSYAASDVIYLAPLYNRVKHKNADPVYQLDIATQRYMIKVTRRGMPTNRDTVRAKQLEYMNRREIAIRELPVNPESSPQCSAYLGTKSSDASTLVELIKNGGDYGNRAKLIQEARHCRKALSYLKVYDRDLVHGFFNASAALAGRMSCTGGDCHDAANLQQVPSYLQPCFEAPDGKTFVYKDYSGLELRMGAAYVGDPTMCQQLKDGADLHQWVQNNLFSNTPEDLANLYRTIAKVFNFNLIFGGGAGTVSATIYEWAGKKISVKEVKAMMDEWFALFPWFMDWHNMHKQFIRTHGYVDIVTALGRKVRTYSLPDSLNFPIQGSSVEVTKSAMQILAHRYPDEDLRTVIHDAGILVVDDSPHNVEMWGTRLSECMVDGWNYVISGLADPNVPMPHGYKTAKAWTFK